MLRRSLSTVPSGANSTVMRWVSSAAMSLVLIAVVSACSSDTSSSGITTSVAAAVPIDSAVATTLPLGVTSTESAALAPGFELGADGVGDIGFGAATDVVVAAVSASLGPSISDAVATFATSIDGINVDEVAGLGFAHPIARTVCWPAFCAFFGGADPSATVFVGWDLSHVPAVPLTTVDGVTIGTRWSEASDAMTVQPGGCPTAGFGSTISGVELRVSGGAFSRTDGDGEYVELLPDRTEVTVIGLAAGSRIIALEQGC
ncbi:MAG: hypothetical protein ABIR32_05585 [Ilumatobacteraceae bacterium]